MLNVELYRLFVLRDIYNYFLNSLGIEMLEDDVLNVLKDIKDKVRYLRVVKGYI